MTKLTRRNVLHSAAACAIPPGLLGVLTGCGPAETDSPDQPDSDADRSADDTPADDSQALAPPTPGAAMKIHYLEIVTPEVDALCEQYAKTNGISFGESDASLGGARTATLDGGCLLGIRGPLRDTETPVVRPYVLVDDLDATVKAAADAGAEVAIDRMEIPGHGTIAIVVHGGIECGFWQT